MELCWRTWLASTLASCGCRLLRVSVRYCAQELFLSPNYFGDLVRQLTGDTAKSIISRFVMQRARELLAAGVPIAETSERLGYDYPQHFTRQFKKHFGLTPSDFLKSKR